MTSSIVKQSISREIPTQVERETLFLVKTATPFIAAVKRIDSILDKFDRDAVEHKKFHRGNYKKIKYIRIKGLGKAMVKVSSLAAHYIKKGYKVDVYTGSIEVTDEVHRQTEQSTKDDESDTECELKKRNISYMEVKVWLKRDS